MATAANPKLALARARCVVVAGGKHRHRQAQSAWFRFACGRRRPRNRAGTMTLNFPNESRSFDGTRRAVRFWGHDSAMEATFFVTEAALKNVAPDIRLDEPGMLRAFDSNRSRIYAAAARVYARGRRGSYDVAPSDF
jgi:hypothetical protein